MTLSHDEAKRVSEIESRCADPFADIPHMEVSWLVSVARRLDRANRHMALEREERGGVISAIVNTAADLRKAPRVRPAEFAVGVVALLFGILIAAAIIAIPSSQPAGWGLAICGAFWFFGALAAAHSFNE